MVAPGIRPHLAAMLSTPLAHPMEARAWLRWLRRENIDYHLDDDPGDISGPEGQTFSEDEARLVRLRVAEIRNQPWKGDAFGEPFGCHHGYMCAQMLTGMTPEADAERITTLAAAAYPIDEADAASERQIDAQTAFFADLEARWPLTFGEASPFMDWCLKATTEEMIDEALGIIWRRELWLGESASRCAACGRTEEACAAEPCADRIEHADRAALPGGPLFAAIDAAAMLDDLDDAARTVQLALGVTDGGFASHFFSGERETGWTFATPMSRRRVLIDYAHAEIAFNA